MLSVGKEDLILAIWLVVFELAAVYISILSSQLALSLPRIKMKLSFVACVFLSVPAGVVLDETLAMHFTFQEGSLINLSIWPLLYAIARNLAILEFSSVCSSIPHEECRSFSGRCMLYSVVPGTLILKEWVVLNVCVAALAMSELCHGVDVAHESILLNLVLTFILYSDHLFEWH